MEQDISLMELYLTDLSNIKKLSETEEKELFYQYKNGNLSVKDTQISEKHKS